LPFYCISFSFSPFFIFFQPFLFVYIYPRSSLLSYYFTFPSPSYFTFDLVPITGFTFGACLAASATSGAPRFGGLTGGVYKAQEPIHRGSADPRLLAIPASCGQVAARNPNWGPVFAIGFALRRCDALSGPL